MFSSNDVPKYSHLLLAGMYNRRVTDVREIIDRLLFTTAAEESETNILMFNLFQLRLKRYLVGSGHPTSLKGTAVSAELIKKDLGDPLLRCRLFLLAMTDSDLLPLDANAKLEVSLF
jgi:hypothetical protein